MQSDWQRQSGRMHSTLHQLIKLVGADHCRELGLANERITALLLVWLGFVQTVSGQPFDLQMLYSIVHHQTISRVLLT